MMGTNLTAFLCFWNLHTGPEVIKIQLSIFFPANRCENANNSWHTNVNEQKKSILGSQPENARVLDIS